MRGPKDGKARTIPLPFRIVRTFAHHLKEAPRLKFAEAYEDRGLVFASQLGRPLDLRNIASRHFKPALGRPKLPKSIRLYDLRHSFATLALSAGVHAKVVAARLGRFDHDDVRRLCTRAGADSKDATHQVENALFSSP